MSTLLKISELSKSTYFYAVNKVDFDEKNEQTINEISNIYNSNKGRYGYRRITLELKNRGYVVNHKKVKRIMTLLGLYGIKSKAKYKSYKGDMHGTCQNLLLNKRVDEDKHMTVYDRDFETTAPNQKWGTDVTEFHIPAGKLYLSPIIDFYTREIISFDISISPNFKQTTTMLIKAFGKFDDTEGIILHSDQGWQYQMYEYREMLRQHGIIQSMSRKGNCLDNSPTENFFGIMKREMFYGHEFEFQTLNQLKQAIIDFINYYNNDRISCKLKGLSPINFRHQSIQSPII